MTQYSFKNGITVTIPDDLSNPIEEWTHVKMMMSIALGTPSKGKPVQLWPDGRKKNQKTWRSPKKLAK
jgi:hypothetical protein